MRVLTLSERRVLDRIELEHMAHAGSDNGKLPVTYADFEKWGVRRDSIAGAIRALEALGIIETTRRGYAGAADMRTPSHYRLTFFHAHNAGRADATGTHEYMKITDIEKARVIAGRARKASDRRNVDRGKIQSATPQKEAVSPHNLRVETENPRPANCGSHGSPPNCGVLSISREVTGESGRPVKRALDGAVACRRPADRPELRSKVRRRIFDTPSQTAPKIAESNEAEP
jgi:hypothetical protein